MVSFFTFSCHLGKQEISSVGYHTNTGCLAGTISYWHSVVGILVDILDTVRFGRTQF
jgi:hypothetical protein